MSWRSTASFPHSTDDLRCSFCGKRSAEVEKLIAGPSVFICDQCVLVCVEIIADEVERQRSTDPVDEKLKALAAKAFPGHESRCSFCGTTTLATQLLRIEDRGLLCGTCADLIDDVLSRGKLVDRTDG